MPSFPQGRVSNPRFDAVHQSRLAYRLLDKRSGGGSGIAQPAFAETPGKGKSAAPRFPRSATTARQAKTPLASDHASAPMHRGRAQAFNFLVSA
jgi:hypothetical protein